VKISPSIWLTPMVRPFSPRMRVGTYTSAWMPTGDATTYYAGYLMGGYQTSETANIQKFDHTTELQSQISATLTTQRNTQTGLSSTVKGYSAAGMGNGSFISLYDALTFSSETRATLSATMATNRRSAGGASNFSVAGYVAGGTTVGSTSGFTANIEKFTYSTEANSVSTTSLTQTAKTTFGGQNSGVAGYFAGGLRTYSPEVYNNNIWKISFSTDTVSSPASMSNATYNNTVLSNQGTCIYLYSGDNASGAISGNPLAKVAFSTDTYSVISGQSLENAGGYQATSSEQNDKGYFVGGGSSPYKTVRSINYATDVRSNLAANASVDASYGASCDFNGVS